MTVNKLKQEINKFLKTHNGNEEIMFIIRDNHLMGDYPITYCGEASDHFQVVYNCDLENKL